MKKNIKFHLLLIAVNIIILSIVLFTLHANNKIILASQKLPSLEKLYHIHKERLKSNDIDYLRKHTQNLWLCHDAVANSRKRILEVNKNANEAILWALFLEAVFFFGYYISKRTKEPKANNENSRD